MFETSVWNRCDFLKRVEKVSIYLMIFLAMAILFAPLANASHCTSLKKKADDAKQDWAVATAVYLTTSAATAVTCATAARTKSKEAAALCVIGIAASATAGWWMGVTSGRYYDAVEAYSDCQREHDPN